MKRTSVHAALRRLAVAALVLGLVPGQPRAQTSPSTTTTYTYDAVGRLVAVGDRRGAVQTRPVEYRYDPAGNRIQVGNTNGVEEFVATFSASPGAGQGTGLNGRGMSDARGDVASSVYVTSAGPGAWIQADLGSAKAVGVIDLLGANMPAWSVGPANANGAEIEYSVNGENWDPAATLSTVATNAYVQIDVGDRSARYWRLRRTDSMPLALGDFRLFSADHALGSTLTANTIERSVALGASISIQTLQGVSGGTPPYRLLGFTQPSTGQLVQSPAGSSTLVYTAPPQGKTARFTFTVADAAQREKAVEANITLTGSSSAPATNHPPVGNVDTVNAQSGVTTTVYPLTNDTDEDGDAIRLVTVITTAGGVATANPTTGAVTYTPAARFTGQETIYYTIADTDDDVGYSAIFANVSAPTNQAPVAMADLQKVRLNTPVTFKPQANDTDADGDTLRVKSITTPSHGSVVIRDGGASVTYTPAAGYLGTDTATYVVSDGQGGTASATITLTIGNGAGNTAPTAANDAQAVPTDGRISFDPRLNDQDPDGDNLLLTALGTPAHGAAVIVNSAGAINYTPAIGYAGPDSFTYTLSDGRGGSATATVNISVYAPRSFTIAPAVNGKTTWNLDVDGSLNLPTGGTWVITPTTSFQVATKAWGGGGGPVKPGGMPGFGGGGGYAFGSVALDQGVAYRLWVGAGGGAGIAFGMPNGGYPTSSNFAGSGGGYTAVLYESDEAPLLVAGAGGGAGWGADGGAGGGVGGRAGASYGSVTGGAGGTQTSGAAGSRPDLGGMGEGQGSFGGGGGGGFHGGAGGQSVLGVGGGGGGGGSGFLHPLKVTSGVLLSGFSQMAANNDDPDRGEAGAASSTIGGQSGPGRLILVGAGSQVPLGANRVPTAVDDTVTIVRNFVLTIDPRTNDSDPDLDRLSVASVTPPSHGTATLAASGGGIIYTPAARYAGLDSFSYVVSDGRGGSATATVWITVQTEPNVAPTANADTLVATAATAALFDPRSNDTDPNNDPLAVTAVGAAAHGVATVAPGGAGVSYTATSGYFGPDSFTYTLSDGEGGSATATVSVTVFSNQRVFTISPAINGRSTWNLDVDGSVALSTPGNWTLTPQKSFIVSTKAWGAGGGTSNNADSASGGGGAGGYAGGDVQLAAGVAYRLDVGAGGAGPPSRVGGAPGGGSADDDETHAGAGGGGFTAIREVSGAALLVAGGGGGTGWLGAGGAGGGAQGEPGVKSGGAGGTAGSQTTGTPFVGGNGGGTLGGGGGGGYRGGGGGQTGLRHASLAGGGGGGGSGFASPALVLSPSLVSGAGGTPGRSTDPDRGAAGETTVGSGAGKPGKLVLVGGLNANRVPVAANDVGTTQWRTPLTLDPRLNDSDPDGDGFTVTGLTAPAHGSAVVGAGGASITYTPIPGYSGADSFNYVITDAHGGVATGVVTITVTPSPNLGPTAFAYDLFALKGVAKTFDPRAYASDPDNDPLFITAVSTPAHGTATVGASGDSVTYTASSTYTGADSFTYTIVDPSGASATGSVTVTVAAGVNSWDPANKASYITLSNNNLTATRAAGTGDGSVRALTATSAGKMRFEVTIGPQTNAAWRPGIGIANSTASMSSYLGVNQRSIALYAEGVVWGNTGWPPLANTGITFGAGDTIAVEVDVTNRLIYFQKVGGPRSAGVSFSYISGAVYPAVTLNASSDTVTGNFSPESWSMTPTPGFGPNTNNAPVANGDAISAPGATATTFDPRFNDRDADGHTLMITQVTSPGHGTAVVANGGTAVTYTGAPGYSGADSFTYTISDGHLATATATVTVTVGGSPRTFMISPAVNGKSTWNLDLDGPLNLGAAGTWSISPVGTLQVDAMVWGAAAGQKTGDAASGGGGAAAGLVTLMGGGRYSLIVGGGGQIMNIGGGLAPGGIPGGGASYFGASGGGYSGIRAANGGPAILIAGGGGGGGHNSAGGAGGGSTGAAGVNFKPQIGGGQGGTQSAGGAGGVGTQTSTYPGWGSASGLAGLPGAPFQGGSPNGNYAGGGGGGYFGGGGGAVGVVDAGTSGATNVGSGGGGGSSYYNPSSVTSATLYSGTGSTPGAASDARRAAAGSVNANAPGSPGRVILTAP